MMSDDDRVGYKKPPKHSQFAPGESGNRAGRPPRARRALLPAQIRKDILEIADEVLEMKTAKGTRTVTRSQATIIAISNGAVKGNPTCLKLWMNMLKDAVQERRDTYPSFRRIENLIHIVEDPCAEPDELTMRTLDSLIKRTKRLY